ncbi:MFS transporter [Streptomyces flaveolus]|uniref:MFS transporter n=1 Tax=Streptomyces flaveolus TaxID=67297 RepID=UPI0036FA50A2
MQTAGAQWLLVASTTLTFLLGCGTALTGPAWQAIQPELVEREQLGRAAALGAVNMNLTRAVGPALGAAAGAGWFFAFDALSYLGVAAVLNRVGRGIATTRSATSGSSCGAQIAARSRYTRPKRRSAAGRPGRSDRTDRSQGSYCRSLVPRPRAAGEP